jgi:hypothetical protein
MQAIFLFLVLLTLSSAFNMLPTRSFQVGNCIN